MKRMEEAMVVVAKKKRGTLFRTTHRTQHNTTQFGSFLDDSVRFT